MTQVLDPILSDIEAKRRKREETMIEVYEEITRRRAAGEDLTPAESRKWDESMTALGKTTDDANADLEICKRELALAALKATRPEKQAALDAISNQIAEVHAERAKANEGFDACLKILIPQQHEAAKELKKADDASDALDKHRAQHWQLLGAPDPAIEARKFCMVCKLVEGDRTHPTYPVRDIEAVMIDPAAFRTEFLSRDPADLATLDGQTIEQARELFELARNIALGGRKAKYVFPTDDPAADRFGQLCLLAEPHAYDFKGDRWNYEPVRVPGRSTEEFEELLATLKKDCRKNTPAAVQYIGR